MTTVIPEVEVEETVDVVPYDDTEDGKNHKTHIVNPPSNLHLFLNPNMSAQDIVDLARMSGQYVVALCGYKWIPKRNPDKYPVCQRCMDIACELMRGAGE